MGGLAVGTRIRRLDGGSGTVEAVATVSAAQPMFNLTVAEARTFFVGDGAWLVHNIDCTDYSDVNPKDWPTYDQVLDPRFPTNPANGQARDAGHLYGTIIPGGTGRAISAHGVWEEAYGYFTVPHGTTVRSWFGGNHKLREERALQIEGGQYTTAMRETYGMFVPPDTFGPGSQMRNFKLTTSIPSPK